MALLFNRGTLEPGIATATNYVYGSTATAVADIAVLATENKFVMTSKAGQKTIQAQYLQGNSQDRHGRGSECILL